MVDVTCQECKKKFKVRLYKKNTAKYCSRDCNNKNSHKTKINCKICNKEFEILSLNKNKIKYCSNKCKNEDNISYCLYCNGVFNKKLNRQGQYTKYCCIQCYWKYNKKSGL